MAKTGKNSLPTLSGRPRTHSNMEDLWTCKMLLHYFTINVRSYFRDIYLSDNDRKHVTWMALRCQAKLRSKHPSKTTMALRLPRIVSSKKVPKGYFAVYVGENKKRFVIPVSFLNRPLFQDLLGMSEEEFGYSHPTGGLTIPCNEDIFVEVTSRLN
ncbi:hypothetical protein V6N13_018444 [Hibiscus sabdariffa]